MNANADNLTGQLHFCAVDAKGEGNQQKQCAQTHIHHCMLDLLGDANGAAAAKPHRKLMKMSIKVKQS